MYVVVITLLTGLSLAWLVDRLLIDEFAKRALSRIYAPLLSLNYSDEGQRNITLVTLDDTDLQEYGLSWPVPMDYYQRLVDSLVKLKPKSIFLDVLFLDDRPDKQVQSLITAACLSTEQGVPFYLASLANETLTSNTEKKIFDASNRDGRRCVIPVRSNISPDALDQSQWSYPLHHIPGKDVHQANRTGSPTTQAGSVAWTLYCDFFNPKCQSDSVVPLALIWATQSAYSNVQTMVTPDRKGLLTPACRGNWNWWEAVPGSPVIAKWMGITLLPLCPYNQVIPIRAFKGQGFTKEQLRHGISGRVVMVGADLKAIGDNVQSPVHGRLPGIHVHAMALDNLISFKGLYKENGGFDSKRIWHSRYDQFVVLSITLTALIFVLWNHYKMQVLSGLSSTPILQQSDFETWRWVKHIRSAQVFHAKSRIRQWVLCTAIIAIKVSLRLSMLLLAPLMLLSGGPRFISSERIRREKRLSSLQLLVYLGLGSTIFLLGYVVFRQGPLVIVEFILFPLTAHYLKVGETIADNSRQLWRSLRASNPWAEWAKQGLKE